MTLYNEQGGPIWGANIIHIVELEAIGLAQMCFLEAQLELCVSLESLKQNKGVEEGG